MAQRNLMLKFGLIAIPCKTETAIEAEIAMSNLCVGQPGHEPHEATPVKAPTTCEACGPITDRTALVKGVKAGQTYTLINQEDVAAKKVEFAAEYKGVLDLIPHPADEFMAATAQGDTLHYVTPADAGGADHYQLIVKLVQDHPELVFAGLHTPVSKTGLYMLRVRDGVLVLESRTRGQAVKATPSVGGAVNDALYQMLEALLDQFVQPYDAEKYEDRYKAAMEKMLAESSDVVTAAGKEATPVATVTDEDLMTKLRALKGQAA